jgi:hypothetical protein
VLLLGVVPLLSACPDDGNPNENETLADAAPPPVMTGSCAGRAPDPDAPFSSVAGTGSVSGGKWTVALASIVSGYAHRVPQIALKNNNEELRIFLSTSPNACGRVRSGVVKSGEPLLLIAPVADRSGLSPRNQARSAKLREHAHRARRRARRLAAWPLQRPMAARRQRRHQGHPGHQRRRQPARVGQFIVLPSTPADAGAAGVEPLVIEFDVPFCGSKVVGAPTQCCVP